VFSQGGSSKKAELATGQSGKNAAQKTAVWSIGIFSGPTLSDLKPVPGIEMPALSARHVTDIHAEFVADPFMIRVRGTWHMFFEVMNARTDKGDIGLATSSNELDWKYEQIVLSESCHLSYPCVFTSGDEIFMVPESYRAGAMRLYRADPFPLKWSFETTLLKGPWVDSSIFFFEGRWWMFSNPADREHDVLELFYADTITGPWQRHPMSPLIRGNKHIARCGGRTILANNKLFRFAQDCFPVYGTSVRAFEILSLNTCSYAEQELPFSPVLSAGEEFWRQGGMHHIDPHCSGNHWLACVDGWRFEDITQEPQDITSQK